MQHQMLSLSLLVASWHEPDIFYGLQIFLCPVALRILSNAPVRDESGRRRAPPSFRIEFDSIASRARSMPDHNFHIGEIVEIVPAVSRSAARGVYVVTKSLTQNVGECEYRIKSIRKPHERVARESEMPKAKHRVKAHKWSTKYALAV